VIYLVGGGDPTILRSANSPAVPPYPQPATLAGLARATAAALPTSGRFELRTDTAAWGAAGLAPGWSPDYLTEGDVTVPSALELDEGRLDPTDPDSPRTATPVAQAGAAFAALLTRSGVHLRGAVTTASAPSSARAVAQVQSPPLAELVQRMLTVSDNDLAEALGRAVAVHDGMLATFAGAAAAVRRSVAALGVEPALVSLDDASGLSHADRVAPRALVTVLRAADSTTRPELRSIIDGLPVAGFTGTLADRYRTKATSPSAGIVRAKTGSLTAVNALAGQVVDASGRLLIFALLVSASPSPQPTIDALDRLVSTLAGCGCSDAAG
jgi:D-alanyl-D-alanine carboxypeptidase/D-alanyl-D-alanine-endopeptidase (penicillin-binding protein 4)